MKNTLSGFIKFIRTQGVVGLAVGFILGASIQKVVSAFVNDIINPLVGLMLGKAASLKEAYFTIGQVKIMYGDFVSVLLDFIIVAAVIYFGIKAIGLEKLDKKD